jgi:hypothetical protein
MDWKNSRIDALLEQALMEDKAAGDTTTNLTIDPDLRATGSIIARQEMVVAGWARCRSFWRSLPGSTSAPRRRPASRSSAIRRSLTACAFTRTRCWPSSATTPARC